MRPTAPTDDAHRPTVLLVDPDERFRAVLGQLLHDHGYRVVTAVNYAQALVAARREDPTVIVTELRNGQVLTPDAYLQALRRHTPARLILHSDVEPSPFELQAWGLWGAVVKGEPTRKLLDLVATACRLGDTWYGPSGRTQTPHPGDSTAALVRDEQPESPSRSPVTDDEQLIDTRTVTATEPKDPSDPTLRLI